MKVVTRYRVVGVTVVLLVVVGCVNAGCVRTAKVDPLANERARLVELDLAWEAGRYGLAYDGLTELAEGSNEADILWRLSRVAVSRGLAQPEPIAARDFYLVGRTMGWRCLSQSAEFEQRRRSGGWSAANDVIPHELASCALWTAVAWLRWMERVGPVGTEIDLVAIQGLLTNAEQHGAEQSVVHWGRALLAALSPNGTRDPVPLLRQAVKDEPHNLARVADFVFLGLIPAGRFDEVSDIVDAVRDYQDLKPESRNAQKRLLHWQQGAR